MEAISSFETSVDFQKTTRCYIPEDRTLHNHRCENFLFYEYENEKNGFSTARPRPSTGPLRTTGLQEKADKTMRRSKSW
jgi:hypothetical protein